MDDGGPQSLAKSLLIAFVASFAAPIVMAVVAGIMQFSKYGSFNLGALLMYGLVGLFFSIPVTCFIAACVLIVLRASKIYNYDGYAAIIAAAVIAVIVTINYDVRRGYGIILAGGSNALTFFILNKYCHGFFGKITNACRSAIGFSAISRSKNLLKDDTNT